MDKEECRRAFDAHFSTDNYIGTVRSYLWVGWVAAWELLSHKHPETEVVSQFEFP